MQWFEKTKAYGKGVMGASKSISFTVRKVCSKTVTLRSVLSDLRLRFAKDMPVSLRVQCILLRQNLSKIGG
jgi:hypothetical protein